MSVSSAASTADSDPPGSPIAQPSDDTASSAAPPPQVSATDQSASSAHADAAPFRGRPKRPAFLHRHSSGPIVVHRNHPALKEPQTSPTGPAEFPPNDARAMSPRRSRPETEALESDARAALREHAQKAQSELKEIAESIELVKADHAKLEQQNQALQHYIGGLTRSLSKSAMGSGGKKARKGK